MSFLKTKISQKNPYRNPKLSFTSDLTPPASFLPRRNVDNSPVPFMLITHQVCEFHESNRRLHSSAGIDTSPQIQNRCSAQKATPSRKNLETSSKLCSEMGRIECNPSIGLDTCRNYNSSISLYQAKILAFFSSLCRPYGTLSDFFYLSTNFPSNPPAF